VEAAEEGTVVGASPRENAGKVPPEGELADLHPHVVVSDGHVGIVVEDEVLEMGMGIEERRSA
jgi:hypothetical protein